VFDVPQIRIFLVAEVSLHRAGFVELLERETQFEVVGTAQSVDESLAKVASSAPDIILLDLGGDDRGGAISSLIEALPGAKVIACAVPETEDDVIPCVEAGAAACLAHETSFIELVATIEHVASGESLASPRVTAMLLHRLASLSAARSSGAEEQLTLREREIVKLIDEGLSNKQIAERLYIEVPTVKNHVHNILEKLHVRRRYEAAARMRAENGGSDHNDASLRSAQALDD
jgi:two-component system, NarL family, nitrate/nitrite response regulator NarL